MTCLIKSKEKTVTRQKEILERINKTEKERAEQAKKKRAFNFPHCDFYRADKNFVKSMEHQLVCPPAAHPSGLQADQLMG